MINVVRRVGETLRAILRQSLAALLAMIIVLVFAQVIARYFTHIATHHLAEISRLLMIWMVFSGAALLVANRDLIVIDVVHQALSGRARRLLTVANDFLTVVLLVFLGIHTWQLIEIASGKIAPASGLSYVWFYLPPILFCVLGTYFIFEKLVTFREDATPQTETDATIVPEEQHS